MKQEELKQICDSANEKADCHIKAGVAENSIVIYDSESYDELFGYQVVGMVPVKEVESQYQSTKVENEVLTKIAKISGTPIWTAVQK